ncbi:MAG: hypothetical protein M3540_11000 [Actinomycetota bacterium]|nr:hypothetical protein [Actinomycetota bacterium]
MEEHRDQANTLIVALGTMNGNGSRIWRFRKVDILFLLGVGLVVYGAVIVRVEIIVAGAGIAGIPLTQRGDKAT